MNKEEVSFELKLENAKGVLQELSNPELSLNDGMKKYAKGIELLKEATKMIEEAKLEYVSLQAEDK
jgi:exodeoxyribonuclease VII small subunit